MQSFASSAATQPQLPVSAFASKPEVTQARLSPSGNHVASLVRILDPSGTAVSVLNTKTREQTVATFADDKKFTINWIEWANDDQILVSARYPDKRHTTKTIEIRLLVANRDGSPPKSAIVPRQLKHAVHMPQVQDQIVDFLPDAPGHVLIALDHVKIVEPAVYKLNLDNGKIKKQQSSKSKVRRWIADRQARVRIGFRQDKDKHEYLFRLPDETQWQSLHQFAPVSAEYIRVLGFANNPYFIYLLAYQDGRLAVFRHDLRKPMSTRELVASDSAYDIEGGLVYSQRTNDALGILTSRGRYIFWNDERAPLQRGIDKALPSTKNIIVSVSRDEQQYIVHASNPTTAGTFYLGDRTQKTLDVMAHSFPALNKVALAQTKTISYKARDGLAIEGILTLPPQHMQGPLPAIIFPHSDLAYYATNDFDYWGQLFAHRGYAVLQMNSRGSGGQGVELMQAGLEAVGKTLQTDIEDGTRWLIERNIADKNHICIVGKKFGGYAALMEAINNPDLYKCVVSFAGISSLSRYLDSKRVFLHYSDVKQQLGSHRKSLRERSPLHMANKIQVPVLLAHGSNDRFVSSKQSRDMHKALERAGKPVTYLELPEGTHYLSNGANRLLFVETMDQFLAEHLQ